MRARAVVGVLVAGVASLFGVPVSAGTPRQVARSNREVAVRAADQLVGSVVLPAGATRVAVNPAGNGQTLSRPGQRLFFAAQLDRHAFWTVGASPSAVLASITAHLPAGAKVDGSGGGGSEADAAYRFPLIDSAKLGIRELVVTAVRLSSQMTAVRVDGEVQYLAPRPYSQRVPSQARVLEVTMSHSSSKPLLRLIVTSRAKIRRIAALIDELPFSGNLTGVAFSCPAFPSVSVDTFVFRAGAGGPALAKVSELAMAGGSGPCDPTDLTVRGHKQPALVDNGRFLPQAGSALGVKLIRPTN